MTIIADDEAFLRRMMKGSDEELRQNRGWLSMLALLPPERRSPDSPFPSRRELLSELREDPE